MIQLSCQTNVWKREQDAGKSFWEVLKEVATTGASCHWGKARPRSPPASGRCSQGASPAG